MRAAEQRATHDVARTARAPRPWWQSRSPGGEKKKGAAGKSPASKPVAEGSRGRPPAPEDPSLGGAGGGPRVPCTRGFMQKVSGASRKFTLQSRCKPPCSRFSLVALVSPRVPAQGISPKIFRRCAPPVRGTSYKLYKLQAIQAKAMHAAATSYA